MRLQGGCLKLFPYLSDNKTCNVLCGLKLSKMQDVVAQDGSLIMLALKEEEEA